jgi:hypothetical protein
MGKILPAIVAQRPDSGANPDLDGFCLAAANQRKRSSCRLHNQSNTKVALKVTQVEHLLGKLSSILPTGPASDLGTLQDLMIFKR